MKRLSPSSSDGPTLKKRSVVGSISNRGRNHEPLTVLRQAERKSHGVPRLIGGACRGIAAHVQRLPRLTLKAGRRAGCKAGNANRCFGVERDPRRKFLHLIASISVLPARVAHREGSKHPSRPIIILVGTTGASVVLHDDGLTEGCDRCQFLHRLKLQNAAS